MAVAAMFCIVTTAFFQSTNFYEQYRWHLGGLLVGSAPILFVVGRKLNARFATAAAVPANALEPDWAGEPTGGREPFLLFNLAYWGVMFLVFGGIIAFLEPRTEQLTVAVAPPPVTEVAARAVTPAPAPVVFPELALQGLVYRPGKSSVIFNGATYEVGEVVDGAKVVAITAEQVILELQGERKVYHLERELLKRMSRF